MSRKQLHILGESVKRGESKYLELEVAKLHTHTSVKIPIIVERSKNPGPVLLLLAGVHGDEVNGVEIVRRVIHKKINQPAAGTVICIPVINVFGYLNLSREFPDGRDLNRVFPGSANGSLASQFAYYFKKEIATKIDYALDFHTGGGERENIDQLRCDFSNSESVALAKAFAPSYLVQSKTISKSVRELLNKMNVPSVVFEGGKSRSFDEESITKGVAGVERVMKFLGMKDIAPLPKSPTIIINKSTWLRSPYSGMLHIKAKNGVFTKKGELLAVITDPYGDFEKRIICQRDCYIICINTIPIVHKGDAIFHISTEVE